MSVVPASQLDVDTLAALMTAGYVDYFVPVALDGAQLAAVVEQWDIDLDRSRVATAEDGTPVGLVLLGVRGERGWIGGLGVVPEARRAGVARGLMQSVLAAAPAEVTLEVIEQNEPAIRLYDDLGFTETRMLELWTLTGALPPGGAWASEPRPLGQPDVPWQSADESLPADYERLDVDGGAILFRASAHGVHVIQLAAPDEATARELLLSAARPGEVLRYVNVPGGSPASLALAALGATLDLRQRELRYAR
jgi:ribosomal protein S18 acetylase RimI-like enzyme